MKLLTQKTLCDSVAVRWQRQYFKNGFWLDTSRGNSRIKYAALLALGENLTAKNIDKVIGNTSWTKLPYCDDCGKKSTLIIEFCEDADYDEPHAYICKKCLTKALALMEAK